MSDYRPMFERWLAEFQGDKYWILLDLGRVEQFPLPAYPWFFGVRVPMADRKEDGSPPETELARLNAVENRIRELIRNRDDAVYVGRRTGAGNRDLMFYFKERPRGLEDRIRASIGMEILFISRRDNRWQGYEQLLPSQRELRQIEDLKRIDALINADADPNVAHRIEHRVLTSSPKGSQALAKLMEKLELEDIDVEGEKPEIIVSGIQIAPLDIELVNRISYILDSKAPKARGEYLGWEANPEFAEEVPLEDELDEDAGPDVDGLLKALAGAATRDP